ncbi:MAG: aminopeptidase [Uliginosibacterium sp.]|nr:aminopeptidase [Uliginosibacterium sp.]
MKTSAFSGAFFVHASAAVAAAPRACGKLPAKISNEPEQHVAGWRFLVIFGAGLLLAGCSNLAYYGAAARGQLDLWWRARPVEVVLADPATPPALQARLAQSQVARRFAVDVLALPDNASYRRYADLERPYAVWNVIATPPDSLKPHPFCPMLVGCLPYKGFFSREAAEQYAAELRAQGLEALVYGVAAYSTLGWFADPLLNTFLYNTDAELAGLIFHELTHQQVFVEGDVAFNESLASFVEEVGTRQWLLSQPQGEAALATWQTRRARFSTANASVLAARADLELLYAARPADWPARKAERLAQLRAELETLWRANGLAPRGFWFDTPLANPQLSLVATYHALVPGWQRLFDAQSASWPGFWHAARQLAKLPADTRLACLRGEQTCP